MRLVILTVYKKVFLTRVNFGEYTFFLFEALRTEFQTQSRKSEFRAAPLMKQVSNSAPWAAIEQSCPKNEQRCRNPPSFALLMHEETFDACAVTVVNFYITNNDCFHLIIQFCSMELRSLIIFSNYCMNFYLKISYFSSKILKFVKNVIPFRFLLLWFDTKWVQD